MKMTAVEFSGLIQMNILKILNDLLERKIPAFPQYSRWDKLPNQALYAFQLEREIAQHPVFEGLLGKLEESIQIYFFADERPMADGNIQKEVLCLGLEMYVPGRPKISMRRTFFLEEIAYQTPADAFFVAEEAIKALLRQDPFAKSLQPKGRA